MQIDREIQCFIVESWIIGVVVTRSVQKYRSEFKIFGIRFKNRLNYPFFESWIIWIKYVVPDYSDRISGFQTGFGKTRYVVF